MEDSHHAKRPVKLDYSHTYKGNEELDDILEAELDNIHHAWNKVERSKMQEIEEAKKEAEMIQTLKEIVNTKSVDAVDLYDSSSKHAGGMSAENDHVTREVSKTLKRIQRERDKYSAKNFFNGTIPRLRRSSGFLSKTQDSGDTQTPPPPRRAASAVVISSSAPTETEKSFRRRSQNRRPSFSQVLDSRPMTVPARARPETPVRARSAGLARSRRQLQEMSELDQFFSRPPVVTPLEMRQQLLQSLKEQNIQLQERVNSFVEDLISFNKRQKQPKYG